MNAETIVTVLCGVAIAVGVVGTIIPVLPGSILIGLSLLAWAIWGGAVGLLTSELLRTKDVKKALVSSGAALKATGLGMLAEFGLACLAASAWAVGVWVAAVTG